MRILIAEDDPVTAAALTGCLRRWHANVVVAEDGAAAWQVISNGEPPALAILDWMMPHLDGVELCRRIRATPPHSSMYVLLLTGRDRRDDVLAGFEAGADDYLVKPFDGEELRARVQAGLRIASLQQRLSEKVAMLEEALANVKQLNGLLPICSYCKRIRTDEHYWQQLESYISEHSGAQFSHGICPGCFEEVRTQFGA